MGGGEIHREANHKRLLKTENQTEGWRGWGKWAVSIKEGTLDEPWVLDIRDESLNSPPETKIALYVN